jgi:hypothetical protein
MVWPFVPEEKWWREALYAYYIVTSNLSESASCDQKTRNILLFRINYFIGQYGIFASDKNKVYCLRNLRDHVLHRRAALPIVDNALQIISRKISEIEDARPLCEERSNKRKNNIMP